MNLVKQSLYLCIGLLLALLAAQGAQSLWQVSRLAGATESIVASAAVANDSRLLWNDFREADETFKHAIAFTDALAGDEARKGFGERVQKLRDASKQSRTAPPAKPRRPPPTWPGWSSAGA